VSAYQSKAVKGDKGRRKRLYLAQRDGCCCFYCHTPFVSPLTATLDHYVPVSLWHNSSARNLVLACRPCNERKGAAMPWTFAWLLIRNQRHPEWAAACQPAPTAFARAA